MKRNDINNLKQAPVDDLRKSLKEAKDALHSKVFEAEIGKLKNVWEVRELRRKVARIETFLKQKSDNTK